ncbi:hypothetical protein NIES2101_17945 [Calothrix sp. HK-06]|nr:hypothetical protein NIES2101_17945 [Calothrix sp. HK-06]
MSEKKQEIKLNDLNKRHPAGSEFLKEDEGYLDNLSEEELNARGGADDISVSVGGDVSTSGGDISTSGGDISIGDLR